MGAAQWLRRAYQPFQRCDRQSPGRRPCGLRHGRRSRCRQRGPARPTAAGAAAGRPAAELVALSGVQGNEAAEGAGLSACGNACCAALHRRLGLCIAAVKHLGQHGMRVAHEGVSGVTGLAPKGLIKGGNGLGLRHHPGRGIGQRLQHSIRQCRCPKNVFVQQTGRQGQHHLAGSKRGPGSDRDFQVAATVAQRCHGRAQLDAARWQGGDQCLHQAAACLQHLHAQTGRRECACQRQAAQTAPTMTTSTWVATGNGTSVVMAWYSVGWACAMRARRKSRGCTVTGSCGLRARLPGRPRAWRRHRIC